MPRHLTKIPVDHLILEDRQSFAANLYVSFAYTKTEDNLENQSKNELNACTWREARENERVEISLILPLIACIKSGDSC